MFDAPLEAGAYDLTFKGTPYESRDVSARLKSGHDFGSGFDWQLYEEMTLSISQFPPRRQPLSSFGVINEEILLNLELIFYFF